MLNEMKRQSNVTLAAGTVESLNASYENVISVCLKDGQEIYARAVVLACGTFLNGLLHFGEKSIEGGRAGEPPVLGLTSSLIELGFRVGRLKTGTPPRLDGSTIDYDRVERQDGDEHPIFFSSNTTEPHLPQRPCWITYTNADVHDTIRSGLSRSPLYSGRIKGVGPRYCPSIEDKIVRFADKERHTIFLEPEGLDTDLIYPNGLATSLPIDIQEEAFRKIPGLEHVHITESGYAIDYDFFPPHQLYRTLETKLVPGLYFAGQINGTSGYEEAAVQGLVAGCNAALSALNVDKRLTLERDEAYTGVLIDDLITRGTDEPYRMFTSRAEFRLQLRLDNAATRLTPKGYEFGLVSKDRYEVIQNEEAKLHRIINTLKSNKTRKYSGKVTTLFDLLKRPGIHLEHILEYLDTEALNIIEKTNCPVEFKRRIEAEVKYSGYIKRQSYRASELKRNRARMIPEDFNYSYIRGLSSEGLEKFIHIRPGDLGQAANIPGITPADLAILLIHLKRLKR